MKIILDPRSGIVRHGQDFFASDFAAIYSSHGYRLKRPTSSGYEVSLTGVTLVVSHNPNLPDDARFIMIAARQGIPVVIHVHCQFDYLPLDEIQHLSQSIICASRIIVPISQMTKDLGRRGFERSNFVVIPNGVRSLVFTPSTEIERLEFRRRHNIPMDRRIIGFVGRLKRLKGLRILYEIAAHLERETECLVVQFPKWIHNDDSVEYGSRAKHLRRLHDVHVIPDKNPWATERPIRMFDCLVCPSLSEVQPLVVLEALSAGVPVVVTESSPVFQEWRHHHVFDDTECSIVRLPERFSQGAARVDDLLGFELTWLAVRILKRVRQRRPPGDQRRSLLAEKTRDRGFSDRVMYSRFHDVYEDLLQNRKC